MNEELARLVKENNEMLKRITAWIDKMESPEYRDTVDQKNFAHNLLADIVVEVLGSRRQNNNQV